MNIRNSVQPYGGGSQILGQSYHQNGGMSPGLQNGIQGSQIIQSCNPPQQPNQYQQPFSQIYQQQNQQYSQSQYEYHSQQQYQPQQPQPPRQSIQQHNPPQQQLIQLYNAQPIQTQQYSQQQPQIQQISTKSAICSSQITNPQPIQKYSRNIQVIRAGNKCPYCQQFTQGDTITLSCKDIYHIKCFKKMIQSQNIICKQCNKPFKNLLKNDQIKKDKLLFKMVAESQLKELKSQLDKEYFIVGCQNRSCEFFCISNRKQIYCPLCLD